jgi:RNA polymerase sigma-70 factor (ECF subfamily)
MLASRARRRVQGANLPPEPNLARQRQLVDAFVAASHGGDLDALLSVLDPAVVLRADTGEGGQGASRVLRGAAAVAGQAMFFSRLAPAARPAMVNGGAGAIAVEGGQVQAVLGFTVAGDRIVEINILADPARLARLDLTFLSD